MIRRALHPIVFISVLLCFLSLTQLSTASDKEEKDKLDKLAGEVEALKTEITVLERQVQSMQEGINKTSGEQTTLITQIGDNVASIRKAQSTVAASATDTGSQIASMGERLSATDQRMERLSQQFSDLEKLIQDIPKQPTFAQITPGNAEQLFAAAYSDYSRGNYDLALSEFKQYVESYPDSELTDNAQYWIGEIYYAQKKLPEAAAAFQHVPEVSPKGDKVPVALYKRALVLIEEGQRDEATQQLHSLMRLYPRSPESELAKQQLSQLQVKQ
ncbi:MAG TPA: tol-pal system protein YbgF [Blastocatellia bacterium]|nr:tol-pal system protein YbgF [Blastocatellia bacterium]